MTTQTRDSIHFDDSKSHGWQDLFVVASLNGQRSPEDSPTGGR